MLKVKTYAFNNKTVAPNSLILGDCLDVMKFIPDQSIDMILTDPPYGTTSCSWDSVIPLEPMWEQLKRIIKPKGAIVLTASQPFTTVLISSNIEMFKYCWVWEKSHAVGHLNAWKMPMRNTEDVVVFYKQLGAYKPIIKDKQLKNQRPYSNRTNLSSCYGSHKLDVRKCPPDKTMPKTIIRFNSVNKAVHPTQKPVKLMEYLIKTYTNVGETVLDFTVGSGTTCVACIRTGRKFIAIEKEKKYAKIAKERIYNALHGKPIKIKDVLATKHKEVGLFK